MAASVIVQEHTSTATATDKTSGTVQFKNANNAIADNANPLVIPSSGREYSFEKWMQMRISTSAPSDNISNLEFYTDGDNGMGSGVSVFVISSTSFRPPGIPSEDNPTPLGGSGSLTMVDAFTYTVGGALSLGAGGFSGSGTDVGSFAVLVMRVNSGATQGTTPTETITFSYDEI